MRLALAFAALSAVAFSPASAQAATATATAKANVLKPLQMTGGGTVDFGTIVTPSAATFSGTFTIDAAAAQTSTFCASGFACSGTRAAAMFNLQGSNNANITLNVPTTVTLTLQGATGTPPTLIFTTRNSVSATNSGTGNYTIQLPNSGQPGRDFYVGGSVTINQSTAGGSYQGTFTVTADYQ
ncbi:DUF4402 domain-containing protein [Sphingomonas mesophila]|uniref:DUF4402 domain-containing protein n=1 Tax=Sphingomonas mesophila TaxID=2303576 RepID=UPI000E577266|nr:DUF4402 domain-containing protein [Sphingomonas mesophila]